MGKIGAVESQNERADAKRGGTADNAPHVERRAEMRRPHDDGKGRDTGERSCARQCRRTFLARRRDGLAPPDDARKLFEKRSAGKNTPINSIRRKTSRRFEHCIGSTPKLGRAARVLGDRAENGAKVVGSRWILLGKNRIDVGVETAWSKRDDPRDREVAPTHAASTLRRSAAADRPPRYLRARRRSSGTRRPLPRRHSAHRASRRDLESGRGGLRGSEGA